jgi:VanZ family protein
MLRNGFPRERISVASGPKTLVPCAVPKFRAIIKYWLPVLVWMVIIFSASSDSMSFQHSSRILAPIIHWLLPQLTEETISSIVFFLRKCAHLTEYAVLALLLWRALRKPVRHDPRPWRWADARLALFIVAMYAASDEFHQLFVPHREGRVGDVIIDTCGGIAGLLLLWAIGRLSRQW